MTPGNRFHYCKLNSRSKNMLIILLLVWDFNPMSSLHFLFLCVQDPPARSEGILCSVFTTWRTSHALSDWQGQDRQALHPRWQEVWHPVAGQHSYFHTSLFIWIFSDYLFHVFFLINSLSFFTIFLQMSSHYISKPLLILPGITLHLMKKINHFAESDMYIPFFHHSWLSTIHTSQMAFWEYWKRPVQDLTEKLVLMHTTNLRHCHWNWTPPH